MYALRLRKSTPLSYSLRWLNLRQRAFGRSSVAASESLEASGTKFLESFREEFEIGSCIVSLETGEIARFANGAVVLGVDHTNVLSTVTSAKGDGVRDFLPLTVDYQEKQFAQGLIPTTFMRREGAPKERELLCGRLIDRPIRPLFPPGFYHEVQVMASVLTSDGKHDPDVMAANATSAALMLSDIPWAGPIGVIRIGRIAGEFIVNPTMDELDLSDLNLVYACTKDKTLMIDVQAREISEKDLQAGLRLAHPEAVKFLEPQIRLAAKAGKQKKEYKLSMMSDRTLEKVSNLAEEKIEAVFTDPSYGKFERGEALDKIAQEVKRTLEEDCDEESLKVLPKVVDTVRKQVVRKRIIEEGYRVDGRRLDEVRPVYCKAGRFPALHGSALFSRGDTQVLCTVTLGAPRDAQRLDSLVGPSTKHFMLHYSFPPYSINEVGKRGGLNRREVGHGTLAEKALLAVLPPEDTFRHTIRVNSEVMASDGSTSMASVCGGSMALMDAGIPLRQHVAGISVGLVSEVDSSTGAIKDYRILTDILGLEDHLGDMDFKIAGTRKGVTAIQLDIKPAGIPLDIICESLEHARKGRLKILDHMEHEIGAPHTDRNDRRIVSLKYSNEALRRLIGPLGAIKRKIEEETGARISISDETLTIVAKNQDVMEKVQEKIDFVIGREIQVGAIYKGVVTSIKEYGAFVEFSGGQQGLLHISELSHEPVSKVSDLITVGQQLSLMCIEQDVRGNIKLSLKATLPKPVSDANNATDGSVSVTKEMTNVSVGSVPKGQQDQKSVEDKVQVNNEVNPPRSFTPVVVIRSAAECDEEEKLAGIFDPGFNATLKTIKASRGNQKLKKHLPSDDEGKLAGLFDQGSHVNLKTIKAKRGNQKREKHLPSDDERKLAGLFDQGSNVTLKTMKAPRGNQKREKDLPSDDEGKLAGLFDQGSNVTLKTMKASRGNQKREKHLPSDDEGILAGSFDQGSNVPLKTMKASRGNQKREKHLPSDDEGKLAGSFDQGSNVTLKTMKASRGNQKREKHLPSDDEGISAGLFDQGSNVTLKTMKTSRGNQKQEKHLPPDDVESKCEASVSEKVRRKGAKVPSKARQTRKYGLLSEVLHDAESDAEGKSEGLNQGSNDNCLVSKGNQKQKKDLPDDKESKVEGSVNSKTLKIGSKVTAKVYEIRKHGLVLELGGGIRGMYKFESNGKRDYEVGDELQVECSSFSGKGIPVMSLASK